MSDLIKETSLIKHAIAGDTNAFAELVNTHQLFLYNLALRAVSNPQEAQDITQETFIRAWKGLKNFRGESGFRTWLYRIMMNLCYDRYPRLVREKNTISIEEDEMEIPVESFLEQFTDQTELTTFIHRQLKTLPEVQRLVLSLRFQQDLSYQEISEVMDMPIGTVKTTIFRAKAQLKELLLAKQELYTWIT
jgi:RNA polymerase sigma-70 factor (ECF subfamily)